MTVSRTRDLAELGRTPAELDRLNRSGDLVRIRHGAYADESATTALDLHRQLVAGTAPILAPGMALSHVSAGVLHGLPSWDCTLGRVSVLRLSSGHGSRRTNLYVRRAPIQPWELTQVDGYPVTSLERTAVDLACIHIYDRAVAVLDAALHLGGSFDVMADTVGAAQRRRGVATARAALAFADGRAESVAESISRVRFAAAKLPAPELQVNVYDEFGTWLARSDFGWIVRGVLGEFDGRIKYLGTPEETALAVMKEKAREERLRECGWVVVRWGWSDLADRAALRRRIGAAFEQGRPELIRGHAVAS